MRTPLSLFTLAAVLLPLLGACAAATPTATPLRPAAAPTAAPTVTPRPAVPTPTAVPTAPAATPTPAPKVQRGGTITLVETRPYSTMDPHEASTSLPGAFLLFDGLMNFERDAKTGEWGPKAELAETWTMPDPKTIVFKLRRDVKFHDGSPWNAEVAKWNIDRWLNDPKYYQKAYIESIAGADVIDEYTLKVNLKRPSASTLVLLGRAAEHSGFSMMSQESFEKLGYEKTQSTAVGTGPMEFEQWLRDDRLILKRNPNYWKMGEDGRPLPYIDRYIERTILDPAVALIELKAGNAQIMKEAEPRDAASIKASPDLVHDELPWAATLHFNTVFSFSGGIFSKDLKLRQAAQYAIDRESLARAMGFGIARAHYYPWWGEGMLGYDEKNPRYDFQPERAAQLLKAAGYPNGIDITLSVIARQPEQRIGEIVQNMWNKVGIRTTIDSMDRLVWNTKMRGQDYDAGLYRGNTYPDADLAKRALLSDAGSNFSGAKIPELDKCMAEGDAEYDRAKRSEIYKRCQKIIYENAYLAVGYSVPMNYVYRKDLKGVAYSWTTVDLRSAWLQR
ncbi:MAG: ABC transporter substrate-binding protein [Chloroflexi bacterium]|nr:ABC transporter substrate-binding protein [Chloroflexota bacterium]